MTEDVENILLQENSSGEEVCGTFIVQNTKGLHTRPSTELVKCATMHKSSIYLQYKDLLVNAKSLLGVLTLAATKGTRIKIRAVGDDAEKAVETLEMLAEHQFNIRY